MVKVLILLNYYLPGYKAGGPVRTIQNLVEYLHRNIDFWIVTRDRDVGDSHAYPDVVVDAWNNNGKARVYYGSSQVFNLSSIRRHVTEVAPDIVYLNSFFSGVTVRFLLLRKLGLIPRIPVILASRGELGHGALQLKTFKKRTYMLIAAATKLYSGVTWQATSQDEIGDIRRFERNATVHLAPNLPSRRTDSTSQVVSRPKQPGHARFIFLSRISPKKNLPFALELLRNVEGNIELDIVGPARAAYWDQCRQLIQNMPAHVKINYTGSLPHDQVPEALGRAHFFFLPTLHENFGHAIFEALSAGLPIIVSDQTPWQELTVKGIGWDLPLNSRELWQKVLQECVDMPAARYDRLSRAARHFTLVWPESSGVIAKNEAMFQVALGRQQ